MCKFPRHSTAGARHGTCELAFNMYLRMTTTEEYLPLQTDDAELIYSFIQQAYMGFGTVFVTFPKINHTFHY